MNSENFMTLTSDLFVGGLSFAGLLPGTSAGLPGVLARPRGVGVDGGLAD